MRSRSLPELLTERDLPFEITGGGPVPYSAPSYRFRQYCHINDRYLVVRHGSLWAAEFWEDEGGDGGYVCQVVDEAPDEARIITLYEAVMDEEACRWCALPDHSRDQAELFLAAAARSAAP